MSTMIDPTQLLTNYGAFLYNLVWNDMPIAEYGMVLSVESDDRSVITECWVNLDSSVDYNVLECNVNAYNALLSAAHGVNVGIVNVNGEYIHVFFYIPNSYPIAPWRI